MKPNRLHARCLPGVFARGLALLATWVVMAGIAFGTERPAAGVAALPDAHWDDFSTYGAAQRIFEGRFKTPDQTPSEFAQSMAFRAFFGAWAKLYSDRCPGEVPELVVYRLTKTDYSTAVAKTRHISTSTIETRLDSRFVPRIAQDLRYIQERGGISDLAIEWFKLMHAAEMPMGPYLREGYGDARRFLILHECNSREVAQMLHNLLRAEKGAPPLQGEVLMAPARAPSRPKKRRDVAAPASRASIKADATLRQKPRTATSPSDFRIADAQFLVGVGLVDFYFATVKYWGTTERKCLVAIHDIGDTAPLHEVHVEATDDDTRFHVPQGVHLWYDSAVLPALRQIPVAQALLDGQRDVDILHYTRNAQLRNVKEFERNGSISYLAPVATTYFRAQRDARGAPNGTLAFTPHFFGPLDKGPTFRPENMFPVNSYAEAMAYRQYLDWKWSPDYNAMSPSQRVEMMPRKRKELHPTGMRFTPANADGEFDSWPQPRRASICVAVLHPPVELGATPALRARIADSTLYWEEELQTINKAERRQTDMAATLSGAQAWLKGDRARLAATYARCVATRGAPAKR